MGDSLAISQLQPNQLLPSFMVESNNIVLNPKLALRPYQSDSLAQLYKSYREGKNRLLVSLPTGTGKTILFSHLVARTQGRSLVIAHRDELLEQAANKIKMLLPNADVGIVKAERNQLNSQIVVASVQTLAREKRLAQLGKDFSTIIVDEAHHATADTYIKVLKSLGCFNKENPPLTLGVTATPERGDKVGLDKVFQEIVYHRNLLDMMSEQYLSDLTWKQLQLNVDLDNVETRAGDFIESQLIKALSNTNLPEEILNAFQQYASKRKTIVFVPGVALARETATLFQQHNIKCESIDGKLSTEERKAILARLTIGETQVVVNCLILTEGFDEPSLEAVIFARPTKSKSFYLQMLGRGTRLHPGKTDCLVIDLVGVTQKHKLVTLPNLFGLAPDKLKSKSVLTAHQEETTRQAQLKAQAEAKAKVLENQTETSETRKAVEAAQKEQRTIKFNWLKLSDNRYALSMGQGIIFLIRQPNTQDKWVTLLNEPDKTKTLLAKDLPLDYAQGVAQDYVRNLKALVLIDMEAEWRKLSPSQKQLDLLEKLSINFPDDVNKGQASDLITLYIANQDKSLDKFVLDQTQEIQTQIQSASGITNIDNSSQNTSIDSQTLVANHSNNNNNINSDKPTTIIKPNITIDKAAVASPENNNKVLAFPQKETPNQTKAGYTPVFAKYCFAQNIEHLKLYDTYTLDGYVPKGQLQSQTRSSQIKALSIAQDYVNDYFNQEIGIIFAGKANVGKSHLAIAVLRDLTTQYRIPTLFCDCRAVAKHLVKQGYQQTLDRLTEMIEKSEVVLLDNLTLTDSGNIKKELFCELIDCCSKYEKKLIITTNHLNHSSSSREVEDIASQLSLGDVLGIDSSSKLYNQCVYIEIIGDETNQDLLPLPTINTENAVNNTKTSTNKPKSSFSSIADIVSNIFNKLRTDK